MNSRADSESAQDSAPLPGCVHTDARSTADLARRAEVIATGQVPFPEDLPDGVAERLRLEVARQRQKQFVKLIARAIARDLQDEASKLQGGRQDDF